MSVPSAIAPARRRSFAPYVLLYLLAASLAVAYLVFLGVRPDLVALWRSKASETQTAIVETRRDVERAIADLEPLKEGVGAVKTEVAAMKAEIKEGAERDRILLQKVETLERTAVAAPEKVAAVPAKAVAAPAAAPKKPTAAAKPAEPAAKAAPAPAAKAGSQAAIETGSIEQKAAPAPAKPTPVGVLLATGPSLDALRLSWTILNDRHADAIRSLHARYVINGKDAERTYSLIAGPLENIADAKAVCKTMTARGMACEVSPFRGNAF